MYLVSLSRDTHHYVKSLMCVFTLSTDLHTNTTTNTRVAYGNSHLAYVQIQGTSSTRGTA